MSDYYNDALVLLNNGVEDYFYPDVPEGTTVIVYKCFNTEALTCRVEVETGDPVPEGTAITEEEYNTACGGV